MIAAITIPLTLILLYVLHAREAGKRRRDDRMMTDAANMTFATCLSTIDRRLRDLVDKPDIDLSSLDRLVEETVHAMNARMDTINDEFHVLTTRVETGAGRRMLSL